MVSESSKLLAAISLWLPLAHLVRMILLHHHHLPSLIPVKTQPALSISIPMRIPHLTTNNFQSWSRSFRMALLSLYLKASLVDLSAFFFHRWTMPIIIPKATTSSTTPCAQPTQNTAARNPMQGLGVWGSRTHRVTHLQRASHWSPSSLRAFVGCCKAMFIRHNHTFIFEIKVLAHNLKKGFQTYIVTRTFIPKNIIQHDDLLKKIN